MNNLKDLFLLDPDVIFLNHGSFGTTPLPVFQVYQSWQRKLENQPVQFLGYELLDQLAVVRELIGNRFNTHSDHLVLIPNATFGVNIVARSLKFKAHDEVLTTDHEYGACLNALDFVCQKKGVSLIRQRVPLPVSSQEDILDAIWQGVTPNTKLIFLSHITSPTALQLPIETICQRAAEQGILTMVDGAHAPGQIDLDLDHIGADFYVGNFHKWMMAPKGSAFLYVRKERQELIDPLVVSWGWDPAWELATGNRYQDILQWFGTIDPSAYLSVPAAFEFMDEHNWDEVRKHCHEMLIETLNCIQGLTGLAFEYPLDKRFIHQMAIAPLPRLKDHRKMQKALWDTHRIEVPIIEWNERHFVRVSIQGYNTQKDIETLLMALQEIIPKHTQ